MNLRQKAKHYKKLADMYGAKTVQPKVVYEPYEVQTLAANQILPREIMYKYDDLEKMKACAEDRVIDSLKDGVENYIELTWVEAPNTGNMVCEGRLMVAARRI